ncbi:hypothetical protein NEIELOOT_01336 [Neisseria elongata subsp. glycolytica ATCC 29315]|uniref:Uncharacterized protein n=1 Tax=Neisseria elongata subsp. glycolytica ATCC 29315 TaxID=546263 RepID=D4DQJ7_NEIEG|nr:hypothetical protein NEIELOOT_01336 [Neisseria elongata subsp. glycolytica ATCC 29315]
MCRLIPAAKAAPARSGRPHESRLIAAAIFFSRTAYPFQTASLIIRPIPTL